MKNIFETNKNNDQKRDWQLCDFDFELPKELIANYPRENKASTPLLVYQNQQISDRKFGEIADFFENGDVLVFNQTRVIKASLQAINLSNQAKIEFNLNQKIENADEPSVWSALCKPSKKVQIGDFLKISEKFRAKILKKETNNFRNCLVSRYDESKSFEKRSADVFGHISSNGSSERLARRSSQLEDNKQFLSGGLIWLSFYYKNLPCNQEIFNEQLNENGAMPLPPYIKRPNQSNQNNDFDDEKTYQTIYAKSGNAVAAPTAGLHFDHETFEKLRAKGIKTAFLNLDVGAGTFLPVRSEKIADHHMHSENFSIDEETCELINCARQNGKKIVAVGTTSLRALESAIDTSGKIHPTKSSTQIFIYPPFRFKVVDALITNFHLPKSTLLMLVAAFVGFEEMQKIYQHAIAKNYRFFSYGDCSLLFGKNNFGKAN